MRKSGLCVLVRAMFADLVDVLESSTIKGFVSTDLEPIVLPCEYLFYLYAQGKNANELFISMTKETNG